MYTPMDYLVANEAMKQVSEEQFSSEAAPVGEPGLWWQRMTRLLRAEDVKPDAQENPVLQTSTHRVVNLG